MPGFSRLGTGQAGGKAHTAAAQAALHDIARRPPGMSATDYTPVTVFPAVTTSPTSQLNTAASRPPVRTLVLTWTSVTITSTVSPSLTTSATLFTREGPHSLTCSRPSRLGSTWEWARSEGEG